MISPLVTLKRRSWVIADLHLNAQGGRARTHAPRLQAPTLLSGWRPKVVLAVSLPAQAGHCTLQPVAFSGGAVVSPAMTLSTRNRSSGSPPGLDRAARTNAEVIS